MKKTLAVAALFGGALLLSGCSFSGSNSAAPGNSLISKWPGLPTGQTQSGSLWKSSDGGHSFEAKSQTSNNGRITGADILSISFNLKTPKTLVVSSVENGIFKTTDAGETWTPIAFPPKKIYSFILDRRDPDKRMFASGVVNDWAKIMRSEDGGATWEEVYSEPGQKTIVTAMAEQPSNPNTIFAGTSVGTIIKSTDAGSTWKNVGEKFSGTAADFAFDARNNSSMYLLIFDKKLYYSRDGGNNWMDWDQVKTDDAANLEKQATRWSAKGNTDKANDLRNQASDLRKSNEGHKMPGQIVSIATDPNISGTIYAGTKKGLFKSTDFGKNWTEMNIIDSAKKFPIRSIAINWKNSNELVFVSGKAFYKSVDGGQTWQVLGLDVDREASFVTYDPFDPNYLFMGLRAF